jgi:hypothetical protein
MEGVSVVVAAAGAWLESVARSFVTAAVVESSGAVVEAPASFVAVIVVGVEEVFEGISNEEFDAPSTPGDSSAEAPLGDGVLDAGGVDVELTNGGALVMYEPFGCAA